jgi:hypothetical protein
MKNNNKFSVLSVSSVAFVFATDPRRGANKNTDMHGQNVREY